MTYMSFPIAGDHTNFQASSEVQQSVQPGVSEACLKSRGSQQDLYSVLDTRQVTHSTDTGRIRSKATTFFRRMWSRTP